MKTPIDKRYNQFPREYNGQFADNDVYIACQNGTQIFSYGHGILEAYIPSKGRGRNIIRDIENDISTNIIFNIVETDSEVLFRFHAKDMDKLEVYLNPRTFGANISPFSTKNLAKTKYTIPDEDLLRYKKIVSNLPQNQLILLSNNTKAFIKSLTTKNNTLEDIKADMCIKGIKGKEYIHSISQWDNYINYLEKELCKN